MTSVRKNGIAFKLNLPLPMPADPAWTARAKEVEKFHEKVNRSSLRIENLRGFLAISATDPAGERQRTPIRADQLAKGIDLLDTLKRPGDAKAVEVWKLIGSKHRIMDLAWLTHVGHKRPDTPKGLPFAEASKKVATIDAEIRTLCAPMEFRIGSGPFGK